MDSSTKYVIENIELFKEGILAPGHVRLEPSEACNFRCNFCVWHDPDRSVEIKDTVDKKMRIWEKKRAISLLEELKNTGVKCVSFTGAGDPLFYPYMDEILNKCHSLDLKVGVTSNMAMKITDKLIDELIRCTWIRWSQNAGDEESHDLIHQQRSKSHSFDRANKNIQRIVEKIKLKKSNTKLTSSVVVNHLTTPYIEKCVRRAQNLNVPKISFRPDVPLFERKVAKYSTDQIKAFKQIQKNDSHSIKIDWNPNRDELIEFEEKDLQNVSCKYSNVSVYIAANFDVYPCCYTRIDKKYIIGNVSDKKFHDFWISNQRKSHPNSIDISKCPSCPHISANIEIKNIENKSIKELEYSHNYFNEFI